MRTRRQFLAALGVVATIPLSALAQQKKVWLIGVLASRRRPESFEKDVALGALIRGLAEAGYVEGRNLKFEWRFSDGDAARLPALAEELVRLEVDLLVSGGGTPAALAAKNATSTIPIVFINVGDPLGNGVVKSLARPGGNITGLSLLLNDTTPKQIELLRSIVPNLTRLGGIGNGSNPASVKLLHSLRAPAESFGLSFLPVEVRTLDDFEPAFQRMSKERIQAFICLADSFLNDNRKLIAGLALKYRLPSSGAYDTYADLGGLMSYGINTSENYKRAVTYIDKILKGTRPGDLPVEQPAKLQLVINLKTAKEFGLTVPAEVLVLTDRVVE